MFTSKSFKSLVSRAVSATIFSATSFIVSSQAVFSSSQAQYLQGLDIRSSISKSQGTHYKNTGKLLFAALDIESLNKFRTKSNLTEDDTVAFVEGAGISQTFGVNSGAQTKAAKELGEPNVGLEFRQSFFDRIQNELKELQGKKMNPDAQSLLHAEAHTLMRASRRYGSRLPKILTIHVDRKTCNFCSSKNGLPLVMRLLKIDDLTVYSPGRNFKLIRKGDIVDLVSIK